MLHDIYIDYTLLMLGGRQSINQRLYIFDTALFFFVLYALIMIMEAKYSVAIYLCDVCKSIHYNSTIQHAALSGVSAVSLQKFAVKNNDVVKCKSDLRLYVII
jgi:hypothetical protein